MIFDDMNDLASAKTKIKVIGVGGAGGNAINHMIENEVMGVEFYSVNTDAMDLRTSHADNKLLIGKTTTHGQGAGQNPEVGRTAALESEDDIHEMIGDAQMVFVTCGMGGGTGTGAAPVIAKVAREHGCLTVGICTKPFFFEGPARIKNAVAGLEELSKYVDTLIVIPNQKLLQTISPSTPMFQAFRETDNILRKGVQGIAESIAVPGYINLDFADVKAVMANKGTALMGIGAAKGPNRAVEAARNAIHNALLEVSISGATDAIVNFSGNKDMTLFEINQAIDEIRNNAGKDLSIIFGASVNSDLGDELVITVVATGYELKAQENGFGDIKDLIFKTMNEKQMEIPVKDSDDEDDYSEEDIIAAPDRRDTLSAIFPNLDPKAEKKRKKEEEKKAKEEAKLAKKNKNKKDEEEPTSTVSMPSWVKKN